MNLRGSSIVSQVYFAHSRLQRDDPRPWQLLLEHLESVGKRAAAFAPPAWRDVARVAGLWHDCGKYQCAFQRYILQDPEASNEGGASRVPHAIVGAALAFDLFGETDAALSLALVIEAHHGALKTPAELLSAIQIKGVHLLRDARRDGLPAELQTLPCPFVGATSSLAIRMVFSALVDADLLDTEAWDREQECDRDRDPLPVLLERLEAFCCDKIVRAEHAVASDQERALAAMRSRVYDNCLAAAGTLPPGQFTLTVPTGGGKTLSGMAFALRHAVRHGKQRIIVVAPYTSILEQTAEVYRTVFGSENVVEHHSNICPGVDSDRNRQATENWDAPVIVTTSVQFFESLHAAHKRPCRKLHRIANSVVLLDEVQTFPAALLKPIHAVLQRLSEEFGTSIVHATATQPLLSVHSVNDRRTRREKSRLNATEIIADAAELFNAVRSRFRMEVLGDLKEPLDPNLLAADVGKQQSALVITHRRDDARLLAELLGAECLHLSAAMCAAHRSVILAEARRRLEDNEPCLLVATQLIEAGVDIDFPVVYRALAGLETLAQAAGRCNRGMKLPEPGRFVVYCAGTPGLDDEPVKESRPPRGTPMLGKQIAEQFFANGMTDLNAPGLFPQYSQRVLTLCDLDANAIEAHEQRFDFPSVAEKFRMIEEHLYPVVIPYGGASALLDALQNAGPSRERYRAMQRYIVGVREHMLKELQSSGWLKAVQESHGNASDTLWTIHEGSPSPYDPRFGLAGKSAMKLRPLQV